MNSVQPFRGRIGIVGAGALGGYYGARLFRAGHDVHFLLRRDYDLVRREGLRVESPDGNFHIRPPVYSSAEALGPCDLVIVGLKTTDNTALPQLLRPVAHSETVVLTLQNGLGNEEAVARALAVVGAGAAASPPDLPGAHSAPPPPPSGSMSTPVPAPCYSAAEAARVVGGIAFLCSNREMGLVRHTAYGWIHLAEFSGAPLARTRAIAELFRSSGVEAKVFDSLTQIRWSKLVWNIPFNGLAVAAGSADTRVILDDPELRSAARALMEEVAAAAASQGAVIEPAFIDHMMNLTEAMAHYKSSMQIDYETRRPLEVEALLGEPYRRARQAGVSTPRMEMLYGIVRRLDALRRNEKNL